MADTWNGNYVPSATDQWNLIADFTKHAQLNNRVIPVDSASERDALKSAAPGGVVPDGTVVLRLDQSTLEPIFDVCVAGAWLEGKPADKTIKPDSPLTGDIFVKRVGGWVMVQGEVLGTVTEGNNTMGQLPTGVPLPVAGSARGGAYMTGGYDGSSWVTKEGRIGITQRSGASRTNPSFTVVYRAG